MYVCVCEYMYSAQKLLTHRHTHTGVHTSAHLQCNGIFLCLFCSVSGTSSTNSITLQNEESREAIDKPNNNVANINFHRLTRQADDTPWNIHQSIFYFPLICGSHYLINCLTYGNCIKNAWTDAKLNRKHTHTHTLAHTKTFNTKINGWHSLRPWKWKQIWFQK